MIKFPTNAEFSISERALAAGTQANADLLTPELVSAGPISDQCGLFALSPLGSVTQIHHTVSGFLGANHLIRATPDR